MKGLADYLTGNLAKGTCRIGQVQITADFCLRHSDDAGRDDLIRHTDPHAAIEIARYDDGGGYRPLKTAPNLKHGWLLELAGHCEVLLALDFLYPAALGTAKAFGSSTLEPVSLRETLERQSGMYAVVKKISDQEATEVIAQVCRGRPGCLRRILWDISGEASLLPSLADGPCGNPPVSDGEIPLLCVEACNLLVAAGREMVKRPEQSA